MGIILRDKFGNNKDTALISMEDVNKVVKDGYNWVLYKKGTETMVVANTSEGRIRLDRLIMNPDETMKVHHINLNPLDNRRKNLENQPI
ncbi:type IV secretory pathway ATPase VirB11/archaellum biosynthesis ATPase [Clostridium beijerinckii]|nr:type IV secretory pathway ATPase VirB11/archaellum biosynthesis ATPase [Clostridium beijerinckii]